MESPNEAIIPKSIGQAVSDTFQVQVGIKSELESATAESSDAENVNSGIDCMSVLGLKSSGFLGSLALGFPKDTFLRVLEKMIGETHEEVTPQNADACSELLNIIFASGRVKLNEAGFDFQPAIPTAVCGKNISLAFGSGNRHLKLTFCTEFGKFIVALSLRKQNGKAMP